MKINCCKCQTVLFLKKCSCDRSFILTTAHKENRPRGHDDKPLGEADVAAVAVTRCDMCRAKEAGEKPFKIMNIGMRQKACPACHTETLSYYDLH